jgi:phage baseplate assembly protein V
MEIDKLLNLVRREAHRVVNQWSRPRVGLVSAYDPDRHAVRVRLQPEDVESGWIPVTEQHVGNGFGIVMGPNIGDQFEVQFQGSDGETGRILGRLYSNEDRPPRVEAGEVMIRHQSGTRIFLDKNGVITIESNQDFHIKSGGVVKVNDA